MRGAALGTAAGATELVVGIPLVVLLAWPGLWERLTGASARATEPG